MRGRPLSRTEGQPAGIVASEEYQPRLKTQVLWVLTCELFSLAYITAGEIRSATWGDLADHRLTHLRCFSIPNLYLEVTLFFYYHRACRSYIQFGLCAVFDTFFGSGTVPRLRELTIASTSRWWTWTRVWVIRSNHFHGNPDFPASHQKSLSPLSPLC